MARDAAVEQAIAIWRLESSVPFKHARFYEPEIFVDGHATTSELKSLVASGPPPIRSPQLSRGEVEVLARIGAPDGPAVSLALALLRRARRTSYEKAAAKAVLRAPGPLPAPVRIEAAYLFAANGMPAVALALLEERSPPPDPQELQELERPHRASPVADWVAREAQFRLKHRAALPGLARPVPAARPPPIAMAASSPTAPVRELEIERLAWIGRPEGPSGEEAAALLRATRGTVQGLRGLRLALAAGENAPLPEPVREVCIELLVEQGDHARAHAVLADVPPPPPPPPVPPGIDVDTPLLESEAATRAASAERVLAGDMERLGVGERHARFQAVAQAAQLTVDAVRALGRRGKTDALRDAARRLEDSGEPGRAAEVFALGGDRGEASRLGVPAKSPPPQGVDARSILEALDALDRRGLRLAAVEAARGFLAERPDVEVAAFARGVLARLVTGPVVTFVIDGHQRRIALGDTVTIGRMGATITVGSPLLSRMHLRLHRRAGAALVEDLGSHNGTWLAGARLTAPLPVGDGLQLALGREIPLSIELEAGAIVLDVAGERTLAPLGPLVMGGLRLGLSPHAGGCVVTLQTEPGVAATLAGAPIDTAVELARGDVVRAGGPPPFELRIVG